MCGISGYISDHDLNREAIAKALIHRGPDDFGECNTGLSGKKAYLAHNRLSIIDLSKAGHQPMFSGDGKIAVIYNGEIYNFETLRDKYLHGIPLKSKSDTEVLLHLYIKFGIEFINILNGDFAIAILDQHKNKLFLIRDRLGVKPLYYYHLGNTFIFGSEIKAILAAGIDRKIDDKSLENYFVFKYVPQQNTLIKNIFRLQPAHYLELEIKQMKTNIVQYWKPECTDGIYTQSKHESEEQLKELLQDACKIRLISDVPVGTFFSGGIDSSIIAWYLKDRTDIRHYTAKKTSADLKNEGTTSDFSFAQLLANKWNLDLVPVDISSQEANTELIKQTLFYSDDLIADGSQIPSYLITREAKKSSTVMLSGMGADEIFFGYKSHQLVLLANLLDKFPKFVTNPLTHFFSRLDQGRGMFKSYRRHIHQFGKYYNIKSPVRYGMMDIVGDYDNALGLIKRPGDHALDVFNQYFNNGRKAFDNLLQFETENFLVKNLHYLDRMCMANGVEGRVPFMDHRIVQFAYNLPLKYKISPLGKTKVILKDAYSEILPSALIKRRKAGFGMPLRSIFKYKEKINQLLDISFFSNFDIINTDHIRKLIENHVSGKEDNSATLYSLISFQEWYKLFIK